MLRAAEARVYQDYALPAPTLDVGCGDGHFATLAFERKLEVGLDPWAGPLREARERGGYCGLVQADGGRMPFPDRYFNSALSNSVLEHIPHVEAVLAETARVLKPGAPFLFCVPNPRYFSELSVPGRLHGVGLGRLGQAYTGWFRKISRVHHADEPETWGARLGRAGFTLERWWHYFSPEAMRTMEWGHYFGAPALFTRAATGRWILFPERWNPGLRLAERLVRPYATAEPHPAGTFTFYIARKNPGDQGVS
jgi:SAM-dependent methyltransferase